jgi:rhodanese-related sulfurtransferase
MSASPGPDVSPQEARALLADGALLLDVRERDEWDAGHAPEAVHVPMSELQHRAAEVPTDRLVVCICHLGARSAAVSSALNAAGWQTVNLAGGMNAWEAAGLPVVT